MVAQQGESFAEKVRSVNSTSMHRGGTKSFSGVSESNPSVRSSLDQNANAQGTLNPAGFHDATSALSPIQERPPRLQKPKPVSRTQGKAQKKPTKEPASKKAGGLRDLLSRGAFESLQDRTQSAAHKGSQSGANGTVVSKSASGPGRRPGPAKRASAGPEQAQHTHNLAAFVTLFETLKDRHSKSSMYQLSSSLNPRVLYNKVGRQLAASEWPSCISKALNKPEHWL